MTFQIPVVNFHSSTDNMLSVAFVIYPITIGILCRCDRGDCCLVSTPIILLGLNHVSLHFLKMCCLIHVCYCCQCFTENSSSKHFNRNCFSENEFEAIIFILRQLVASWNYDWNVGGGAFRLQFLAHRVYVGLEISKHSCFLGLDFQRGMQICRLSQNWDRTFLTWEEERQT